MPVVSNLSIAPVKSMALIHPPRIRLESFGVAENRRFYMVDDRGVLLNGVKFGRFVQIRAEHDAARDHLTMTFPDGRVVRGDVATDGHAVVTNFYGRPVPGREVAGPWAAAVSDYAGRTVRLIRSDRPGDAVDVWPVTILSKESADALAEAVRREAPRRMSRFRMLVEIEGVAPFEEDTWQGRRVRLGGAIVVMRGPVGRCVVTTQDPSTGIKDFDTLRAIHRHRGRSADGKLTFGMYAEVAEPGVVGLGDPVEPLAG